MLFVAPPSHGHGHGHGHGIGIGTRLLDAVAGEHPVVLVDVNEDNDSGRAFYEAKGFEQVGRSDTDGEGRPFPLLPLHRTTP